MKKYVILVSLIALITFGGCVPKIEDDVALEGTEAPEDKVEVLADDAAKELSDEWIALAGELADKPESKERVTEIQHRCGEIASKLANGGFEPLLEILASEETAPRTKLLVTTSFQFVMAEAMLEPISDIARDSTDATTQACATHLLSYLKSLDAKPLLRELSKSDNPRVAFAAKMGLVRVGDTHTRRKLRQLYLQSDTSASMRKQIILLLAEMPEKGDAHLFCKAMKDKSYSEELRMDLVMFTGVYGDESVLPQMKSFADDEQQPEKLRHSAKIYMQNIERTYSTSDDKAATADVEE